MTDHLRAIIKAVSLSSGPLFHPPVAVPRVLRYGLWAILALCIVPAGHAARLVSMANFHAVIPGEVYRSAQLTPQQIFAVKREHDIATILNLRGDNTGKAWYDGEVAAADMLGIDHVDFRMSSQRELSIDEANQLIALMRHVRKPVLIHCMAGADRTGLASALYLAAIARRDEETSENQISIAYGHVSLSFLGAYAMDRTFEVMEPMLGYGNS